MRHDFDESYNEDRRGSRRKPVKIKQKTIGGGILKWFLLVILSIFCILVCVVAGAGIGMIMSTPEITAEDVRPSEYPSHIYDRDGRELIELSTSGSNRQEASSDEIPEMLKNAFIAIEDERFYEHNGIDPKGIARAVLVDIAEGKNEGASTITQQLIKVNVIETGGYERSLGSLLRRKVQEQVMALELEKVMTKDEILTNYLNTIYLGSNCNGVKSAAKFYFGKDLDELTLSECVSLSAITKNPSAYNPTLHPENNQERRELVLDKMEELGFITEAQSREAKADDIYSRMVANSSGETSIYTYFEDALISDVLQDLQSIGYTYNQAYNLLFSGGISIYSTLDSEAQAIIDEEVNDENNYPMNTSYSISWNLSVQKADGEMKYYSQKNIKVYHKYDLNDTSYRLDFATKEDADAEVEAFKNIILEEGDRITYEDITYTLQPQVSFSLMDYTNGQVLALAGGRGDKEQNLSLNRATVTTRQPGSTFKVLAAFAPAMDRYGYTLATVHDDSPFEYEGEINREIENWWGDSYRGLSNIRDAITDSMNIIAAKTLYDIGGDTAVEYLQAFGFESIDPVEDANIATALGGITEGVTNLELCAAYSALANQGTYIEPILYTKIVSRDGVVLLEANQTTRQVVRPGVAALLTSALQDVVTKGTGTLCRLNNTTLAGKTGTTSNDYDLWFTGYIPTGLCGTIWAGYDENITIEQEDFHKELYAKLMNRIVDELGYWGGQFTMPEGIVTTSVCHKSGELPQDICMYDPTGKGTYTEYFEAGTVPDDYCETHVSAYICPYSGLLAGPGCPGVYQTCIVRPDDIKGGDPKGFTADSMFQYPYGYCTGHDGLIDGDAAGGDGGTDNDDGFDYDDYYDGGYDDYYFDYDDFY
ncbi:MAG: transglycosylase domain-containing protein [Parasporobacterium sp.]|nr:transglycosylase domain-containing protein [Parasporobacterium sp.]